MTLNRIQIFELLFNELKLEHWRSSAAYYVLLTEKFPTKFKDIYISGKNLLRKGSSIGGLQKGREELLTKGFIAQVILADEELNFDRETYLPANPLLVWEMNKENLRKFMDQEDLIYQQRVVTDLKNQYLLNLKGHGIGTTKGSVTVLYSDYWLFYALLNNMRISSDVYMMLGGLRSFEEPLVSFYANMLQGGLNLKILFDKKEMNNTIRIKNAKNLIEKYQDKIEIRSSHGAHLTSRRIILEQSRLKDTGRDINIPSMAIDGRKLLPLDRSSPAYVGTFYLQKPIINYLKNNFDAVWDDGKPI
jgi:hypothetical protein